MRPYTLVVGAGVIIRAKAVLLVTEPEGIYWSRGSDTYYEGPSMFFAVGTRIDGQTFTLWTWGRYYQYRDQAGSLRMVYLKNAVRSTPSGLSRLVERNRLARTCRPSDAGMYA